MNKKELISAVAGVLIILVAIFMFYAYILDYSLVQSMAIGAAAAFTYWVVVMVISKVMNKRK